MNSPRLCFWLGCALFLFSGAAGLGSQLVWTRMLMLGMGHEFPATLAVVAAFMAGMGAGAWGLDRRVSRSARPGAWYAGLEAIIGVWSVALALSIPDFNRFALDLIGPEPSPWWHWAVAFVLPALALLPATAAMGATLPALERWLAARAEHPRCVGALYAANTLGAAAGALASAFVLMPWLGLRQTALAFAALNLLCAVAAFAVAASPVKPTARERRHEPKRGHHDGRLLVAAFGTGLLGIGYEVLGVRMVSQVLENTVYTYAAVLAVFLTGTAVGAAAYQRHLAPRLGQGALPLLFVALAAACLAGTALLPVARPVYAACRAGGGDGVLPSAGAEIVVAGMIFMLPTLVMGATFSHLVQQARRDDGGVGWAAALNTWGGALAPAVVGVGLLPHVGGKGTFLLIAGGYLALLLAWPVRFTALLVLPAVLAAGVMALDLRLVELSPGEKVLRHREGIMASVSVVEDTAGERSLRVNNRFQMGGTATSNAERRHAQIPLLLHPAPRRALFLGLGTVITLGAASAHRELLSDGVELLPEVIEVMPLFAPANADPARNPRLRVMVADARRFVRTSGGGYDVIVADLFHPSRDGAGALYTREHFIAVRDRLAPGGVFCQWLPLYQLDDRTLRVIVRTFLDVFPTAEAWLLRLNIETPVIGLVGYRDAPAKVVEPRVRFGRDSELAAQLKQLVLTDEVQLFGCLAAEATSLAAFAADARVNTDDHPHVMFDAPRAALAPETSSPSRLLALLRRWQTGLGPFLERRLGDEALRGRVEAFVEARDQYLAGLMAESEQQLDQAVEAYLSATKTSADFTWGYARCVQVARFYAAAGVMDRARSILTALVEARADQPMARELLQRLGE